MSTLFALACVGGRSAEVQISMPACSLVTWCSLLHAVSFAWGAGVVAWTVATLCVSPCSDSLSGLVHVSCCAQPCIPSFKNERKMTIVYLGTVLTYGTQRLPSLPYSRCHHPTSTHKGSWMSCPHSSAPLPLSLPVVRRDKLRTKALLSE